MWRYPTPFASTFLRASRAGDAALDSVSAIVTKVLLH